MVGLAEKFQITTGKTTLRVEVVYTVRTVNYGSLTMVKKTNTQNVSDVIKKDVRSLMLRLAEAEAAFFCQRKRARYFKKYKVKCDD